MKLDILAFGAHPDDVELGCGGTLAKHIAMGKKAGIVDLTRGELGTRGSVNIRDDEAKASAAILGVSVRENLNFKDGFFTNDETHQLELIKVIRRFRPEMVLANAAALAFHSCFLSGLSKVETTDSGKLQQAWRPKVLFHYIQSQWINPDLIVDVSTHWEKKMQAVKAFKSQFHDPNSKEPETYISSQAFMQMLEARGVELGHAIGVPYGEGFTTRKTVGVNSLMDIL